MMLFVLSIVGFLILLPIAVFCVILFAIIGISEWLGGEISADQYWMVVAVSFVIMILANVSFKVKQN